MSCSRQVMTVNPLTVQVQEALMSASCSLPLIHDCIRVAL